MALDLSRQCPRGHYHLPIEGTSPGIGSRAEAAAEYQPVLCSHFCQAIVKIFEYKGNKDYVFATTNDGDEQMDDPINPGSEDQEPEAREVHRQGFLHRLHVEDWQHAKRTVTRLHRNLATPPRRNW